MAIGTLQELMDGLFVDFLVLMTVGTDHGFLGQELGRDQSQEQAAAGCTDQDGAPPRPSHAIIRAIRAFWRPSSYVT
jgi:hypothetical protein